jgi:hypothetical protein
VYGFLARLPSHWNGVDTNMNCVDCGKPYSDPIHDNSPSPGHHCFTVQTAYSQPLFTVPSAPTPVSSKPSKEASRKTKQEREQMTIEERYGSIEIK